MLEPTDQRPELARESSIIYKMSEESVSTRDGQAVLERVHVLERSLNNQGSRQSGAPSSQAGPSGTSLPTLEHPSGSGEYELSQLAANVGNTVMQLGTKNLQHD